MSLHRAVTRIYKTKNNGYREKTVAMGIGKWKNKADYPFGIEGKNENKIYGITFTYRPEQTPKKTWEKLASQT